MSSVNTEIASHYIDRFASENPSVLDAISTDPERSGWLSVIFSYSHFLSEEILRHPEWILSLADVHGSLPIRGFQQRLEIFLTDRGAENANALDLALFRRKELLRIVLRDALQLGSLSEITEEISNLADTILGAALNSVLGKHPNGRFSVIALGKLGGRELNYSSDIDLMYLYSGNGEFYKRAATQLTNLLSTYTAGGLCYRVDLRLRPEGRLGEICISLDSAKEYYSKRARDWELQMLLKARVAAGDEALGAAFLESLEPLIYSTTLDFSTIETMSDTRDRIGEKLARKHLRAGDLDVKLSPGGIRDIEFLAQCLQRLHGGRDTGLRHSGTLAALSRLLDKDLLSITEHSQLVAAYTFLRHLEHRLQFEDDRQTHVLSSNQADLEKIAKRMPRPLTAAQLLAELNLHLENVQIVYERIVHAQRPLYYAASPMESPVSFSLLATEQPRSELLETHPELANYTAQLLENAPFLSEQLVRDPALVEELRRIADHPTRRRAFEGLAAPLTDTDALRRFFRREAFRTLAGSICLSEPIFQTLDQLSALAEFVVARAYRIALERSLSHAREHATPEKPFDAPQGEMMVVALGRLGMREFDLGSDADLLFIIPDNEAQRQQFWTRVVENLIEILTAYTPEGTLISLDTRLRPNGREGPLVQTESKYVEYFSKDAEAWEGIAYMKARGVAGDLDRATNFLNELQNVDWRRYGGGRSKQALRQMRMRLQREQAKASPLKAGPGGYYDADFILMYLRLRGGGMFFKTLNTPERIDIVEKMGHLEQVDAEFLLQATTYYRALDHAIRIVTGRAEQKLPASHEQRAMVANLMYRWTGQRVEAHTLETELANLQLQMRAQFDRLFAQ